MIEQNRPFWNYRLLAAVAILWLFILCAGCAATAHLVVFSFPKLFGLGKERILVFTQDAPCWISRDRNITLADMSIQVFGCLRVIIRLTLNRLHTL